MVQSDEGVDFGILRELIKTVEGGGVFQEILNRGVEEEFEGVSTQP